MKMIKFKKSGGGLCAIAIKKIIRLNPVDSNSRLTNIILSNGDIVSVIGTLSSVRDCIEICSSTKNESF